MSQYRGKGPAQKAIVNLDPLKEDLGEKVEEFIMQKCNHPELGICDSIWRLREGTVSVSEEGIYIQVSAS